MYRERGEDKCKQVIGGKIPLGWTRHRWVDNIKMDLRKI
jgi:hypothetical protein